MRITNKILILTLMLSISVIFRVDSNSAFAQALENKEVKDISAEPDETEENENIGLQDIIEFKGKTYRSSRYPNMSKLYWSFGIPDIENDQHLDIFFQINECDLYAKYYGNEFEWGPLRETMREYLRDNSRKFSRGLFFDLPIEVGNYNIKKGSFAVKSKNFISGDREFFPHPAYLGWNKNFCGFRTTQKGEEVYYREILIRLIRPVVIPNISIDESIAKELVTKWRDAGSEKRFFSIRLYMTVTKFMGVQSFSNQNKIPIFLAYIEGYEIFRDLNMDVLYFTKSFTKKKKGEIPDMKVKSSQTLQEKALKIQKDDKKLSETDPLDDFE